MEELEKIEELQPRGRQPDLEKRRAILREARTLFVQHGYDLVSMDIIATAAGVSKRTVYNHFKDKEALFEAVLLDNEHRVEIPRPKPGASDVRTQLIATGISLVKFLTDPEIVALGRLLISHATRHHELVQRFYDHGPSRMYHAISTLLATADRAGQLDVSEPDRAADQLISMWLGRHHFETQLGVRGTLPDRQLVEHVEVCVDVLLRAYARHVNP